MSVGSDPFVMACAGALLVAGCAAESDKTNVDGDGAQPLVCSEAPPRIVACARIEEAADIGVNAAILREGISGTVKEVASGVWGCDGIGGGFISKYGPIFRFRVRDGSTNAWVGWQLPFDAELVRVGDEVTVSYQLGGPNLFGGGRSPSELVVRDLDDALLAWVGDAPSTAELTPPDEIQVHDADDACVFEDSCGDVGRDGFRVSAGHAERVIDYGAQADVGPFTALHAGNDRSVIGGSLGCTDWDPRHAEIALMRKRSER